MLNPRNKTGRAGDPMAQPPAGLRADARRNYERLLAEARSAFAEHGTDASLEDVARRAGVGIGTLYRHFPNRHALMSAVFEDAVSDLLARSRELLTDPQPCTALVTWLREIVTHAGEYRGLARALMSVSYDADFGAGQVQQPDAGGGRGPARPRPAGRRRARRRLHRRPAPADQRHRAGGRGDPGRPGPGRPPPDPDTAGPEGRTPSNRPRRPGSDGGQRRRRSATLARSRSRSPGPPGCSPSIVPRSG